MTGTARIAAIVMTALSLPCLAHAASEPMLFRVFLTDGTSVVSYGEFARVADSVIVSLVVGGSPEQPRLHAVALPSGVVDWLRTDRYAASARYQQYARTRGEEDFLRLSNDVAAVLNQVLLTKDRTRALETAQQARATLASWPRDHYGYRQNDVREIVAMLDEAIAGLRAAAGVDSFELELVAVAPPVALEPLATMPAPREQLDQTIRAAALVERAAERIALLQSALLLLDEASGAIGQPDAASLRRAIDSEIRREQATDARYAQLVDRLMSAATRAAASARAGDVERILARIPREDDRLGGNRPEVVEALRTSVQRQLEAARRLRLLRDQWTLRRSLYRKYQRSVGRHVLQLVKMQPALEAIRALEGPAPEALLALRKQLRGGADRLHRIDVPPYLRAVHDLLIGAWRFAENAATERYSAVQAANLDSAWGASSAAAGSLMLLSRAQKEIRALLEPPQLQ